MVKRVWIGLLSFSLGWPALAVERSGEELARALHLSAASKAMIQWERVFESERKMKRYGIDRLTEAERERLRNYLIDHAIDSDRPTVAGAY